MPKNTKKIVEKLTINKILELNIPENQAIAYYESALKSKCIEWKDENGIENWIYNQVKPNFVILNQQDYLEAAISSLKVQFNLAGTDFGMSRQRDFGQKWSDTIRGYLGEIALRKYFQEKYNLTISLDHEKGEIDNYLASDIYSILSKRNITRQSKLKISIKTTKANGIWLDIPGKQFEHSDVFILIKLGIGKDHLFSFFKEISVFKDKILKIGKENNLINQDEADILYNQVHNFEPITAYIPGYILAKNYQDQESFYYQGTLGKKNYTITDYAGKYISQNIELIKQKLGTQFDGKIEFESIGNFTQQNRYIFGMKTLEKDNTWLSDIINLI